MSGQGGHHQSNQQWAYDDGRGRSMQCHQQSTASSSSTVGTPAPLASPFPVQPMQLMQPMQPMLPAPDLFQQNHHNLHLAAMQQNAQLHASITQNMFQPMQQMLPAPMAYAQPMQMLPPATAHPQAQIGYAPMSPAPVVQSPQVGYVPMSPAPVVRSPGPVQYAQPVQSPAPQQQMPMGHIEEIESGNDQRIRDLQQRLDSERRERLEKERKHADELAAAQAAATSQPVPAFDLSALQKVLDELRANSLNRDDVRKLVEETTARQLGGVARAEDLASSVALFQQALSNMPASVTTVDLRRTLEGVIEGVMHRSQQNQARPLAAIEQRPPHQPQPWEQQGSRAPLQTEWTVEELPNEQQYAPALVPTHAQAVQSPGAQLHLPAPSHTTPRSQASTDRAAVYQNHDNASLVSTGSRAPTGMIAPSAPSTGGALTRFNDATQATSSRHGSRAGGSAHPSDSASSVGSGSARPSRGGALSILGALSPFASSGSRPSPAHDTQVATRGGQGSEEQPTLPDDFPDNASMITAWSRAKRAKKAPKAP
ncbi:hypothetical protein LTR56_007633 [Elasticomyces elasticus]|nr:hypothetical protein LTR56_007633 [Elasticomyces elasticus]KAK4929693.1 hypothetical protein LTR49_003651 [Elasticomyces elasticus]KAK5761087.1 hypothetical protein LTS12_008764 [Elasticomyces elasticus]